MRERTPLRDQPPRAREPKLHLIRVGREPERALKGTKEIKLAQRRLARELVERHRVHRTIAEIVSGPDDAGGLPREDIGDSRSEERRVGEECRSRWSADHL